MMKIMKAISPAEREAVALHIRARDRQQGDCADAPAAVLQQAVTIPCEDQGRLTR
jgi:hypothetical protein